MILKMSIIILIIFLNINIAFGYYSLKLNKISFEVPQNKSDFTTNLTKNNLTKEQLEEYEKYLDLPLNNSELDILNESYIKTKNIQSELYTIDLYLGSNKQYFRLLLSSFDDFNTISSINCDSCNVTNKYNSTLSNTSVNLNNYIDKTKSIQDLNYKFIIDICSIPTKSKNKENNNINIDNFLLKVIESNISGFLNSDLIDGILSLSYSNNSIIPNNNFILELYNEGKISSPSFSIIITSSNVNRLYLGNIMKNEYVKNYVNSSMSKGACSIIDNSWKCKTISLYYIDFEYPHSSRESRVYSEVNFNLNEKKLTIPYFYYELIVVGLRIIKKRKRKSRTIIYNKVCQNFSGSIYCSCSGKNSFGELIFHFQGDSQLIVDLSDYVYYNESAAFLQCRVDIALSDNKEFIVGLRGLDNTILSFDLNDKKIEFFQKEKKEKKEKKQEDMEWWVPLLWLLALVAFIVWMINDIHGHTE